MRFSLSAMILVTFWAAIGVQIYTGRQQQMKALEVRARSQAMSAQHRSEIARWQQQEVDQRVAERQQELDEFLSMQKALTHEFELEAPGLSTLEPNEESVTLRTLPVLNRPNYILHSTKVSVPKTRPVAVQLDLVERTDPSGSGNLAAPSLEFTGAHPVVLQLEPGIHIVDCLFDYRERATGPYFALKVDGEEVGRITCEMDRASGYSSSSINWRQPYDARPNAELPILLTLKPSGAAKKFEVRLIDSQPEKNPQREALK